MALAVIRRVPLRMQLSAADCAAACLAMVLSAHGRRTSVMEARKHLPSDRDGASARELIAAGRHFGLTLRAFSAPAASLSRLPTPLIAHWGENHFVVVEDIRDKEVRLADPAQGRRRLSHDEFTAAYSGVVLSGKPEGKLPRGSDSTWRTAARMLTGVFGDWRLIASLVVASLVVQFFPLLVAGVTRVVVDGTTSGNLDEMLLPLSVAAGVGWLVFAVVSWLRSVLLIELQTGVAARLMRRLVEHTFTLPFRFFDQRGSGDLLSRLSTASTLRDLVTERSLAFGIDCLTGLGYLLLLAVASPPIAIAAAAVAALQALIALLAGRASIQRVHESLNAQAMTQNTLVESLGGVETVIACGAEEATVSRWRARYGRELATARRRDLFLTGVQALTTAAQTGLAVGLLLIVAYQLPSTAQLGELLALAALAGAALAPLGSLLTTVQQLHAAMAHLERLGDIMDTPPAPNGRGQLPGGLRGRIDVSGAYFGYHPSRPVLRDITLRIEPGQRIAIVGSSGSGKTTLGRLLLGLLEPTAGQISYDDVPLELLDRRRLRQQMGIVTQQPFLFEGTIADNITVGKPRCTPEQIQLAVWVAALTEDITAMPMGLHTTVGESGSQVSGGQRQRIALARAVVHQPSVLLLDEPTSSLDARTEAMIQRRLARVGCTQVVIAHRLSTIRNADLIVVLDRGTIVEQGTHDALVARGGRYAELVREQQDHRDQAVSGV
ncbi:peptidase domain-containing ABC transporter [Nonomuraea harbinensis]|uniref:Peptidase domain-containing ABC transporter n=1 Tax=Nonomuraea harbinensis TaxID=1286938 RepID=A0ABW1BUD6_9ACTN|nr:peptidase domain-containing ABC transporter [Nonomuraea harbinensis]